VSALLPRFLEGVAAGAFFLPLGVALGFAGVSVFCWSGTTQIDVEMLKLTGCSGKTAASIIGEELLLDDPWSGASVSMICVNEGADCPRLTPGVGGSLHGVKTSSLHELVHVDLVLSAQSARNMRF
jgi:hypothetical protein